ncbi:MAG: two-component system sensor histidine kinase NtrB [Betaproteobacteria bacterium]
MSRQFMLKSTSPAAAIGQEEQRRQAWETLRDELAKAGLPAPKIKCYPHPFDEFVETSEALAPADLECRYLDNALLLQEADWFLRDLELSLSEVPHFVALLDRDGWLLKLRGDRCVLERQHIVGMVPGSRPAAGSPSALLIEKVLTGGHPVVALFPPPAGCGVPGWTAIIFPLRTTPQGNAGLLVVAYCDRRISRRVYSQVYTAAAAIERQMLWSDRLAQADRLSLVGTMISQIVHEVKNPLAAMKAALQLAKSSEEAERNECLEVVNREIEELNALVENLLGLAKPAPARFALECLEPILEEVVGLIRYEAALRSIRIDFRPGRTSSFLHCDNRLLKQALLNLTRNAIQAMPHGGVLTLAVHRQARKGGVQVEVGDTGVGMSPDALAHLFEPFFTTKGKAGTGLGLSVTRRIIEEVHQGRISVDSSVGVGTLFTVFLPFNPELQAAETQRSGRPKAPPRRCPGPAGECSG